jgi:hypothetical protein
LLPVKHVLVEYRKPNTKGISDDVAEVQIKTIDTSEGKSIGPEPKQVSLSSLKAAKDKFWKYVNEESPKLQGDGQIESYKKFIESLIPLGSLIADEILTKEMKAELWNTAQEGRALLIFTDMHDIPWESLYRGTFLQGNFLSDNCPILRVPHKNVRSKLADNQDYQEDNHYDPKDIKDRIFLFDPEIRHDDRCRIDGPDGQSKCFVDTMKDAYDEVYETNFKMDFADTVRRARTIHWLCHHAPQGLRLRKDIFLTVDDVEKIEFLPSSIIFLTACKAVFDEAGGGSLAATMSMSGGCSVVAPSSVIAAKAGFLFLRRLNEIIDAAEAPLTLIELWEKVRNPSWRKDPTLENSISMCFGLYGKGSAIVKETGNAA